VGDAVDPVAYLEEAVLPLTIGDVVDVAVFHARHHKRNTGHTSIPREVFCYADHLGYIAFGDKKSASRTARFVRDFFPLNYERYAELLVAMWRHGTVHQLSPYSYRCPLADADPREIEVRWLTSNHNRKHERAQHLLTFPMAGEPDAVYIVVNTCQLADDLVTSIHRLAGAMRGGRIPVQDCSRRIEQLRQAVDDSEAGKLMAVTVRDQMRTAWAQQGASWMQWAMCVRHIRVPSWSELPNNEINPTTLRVAGYLKHVMPRRSGCRSLPITWVRASSSRRCCGGASA